MTRRVYSRVSISSAMRVSSQKITSSSLLLFFLTCNRDIRGSRWSRRVYFSCHVSADRAKYELRVLSRNLAYRSTTLFPSLFFLFLQKPRNRNRYSKFPRGIGGVFAPASGWNQHVEEFLVRATVGDGGTSGRRPWRSRSDVRWTRATLCARLRSRCNDLCRDRRYCSGSASKVSRISPRVHFYSN